MQAKVTRTGFALALLLTSGALAVDYVRLSPSEFAADLQQASRLLDQHDYASAIDLLEMLVADEPDDATALSLMGYALRKSGEPERAERFYSRALAADPHHLGALQYLGELYVEQGQLDLARDQLRLLVTLCAADCAGRDALAAALLQKLKPRR